MNVCEVEYGDFVVWTTRELVIERIKWDEEFYQAGVQKVEQFFCYGILPEIIGKWYTRGRECTTDQNSSITTIGMAESLISRDDCDAPSLELGSPAGTHTGLMDCLLSALSCSASGTHTSVVPLALG